MFLRRVYGNSMSPTYLDGDILFCVKKSVYVPGDVIVASLASGKETIKRITAVESDTVELRGDNSFDSFDSREYGSVPKRAILGSVMMKFQLPKALPPEPLQHPRALVLLYAAGFTSVIILLLQLVKFEDMVDVLASATFSSGAAAIGFAMTHIVLVLLSLPVLLRLSLSPLAHRVSEVALVLAPLVWLINVLLFGAGFAPAFTAGVASTIALPLLIVWILLQFFAAYVLFANRRA